MKLFYCGLLLLCPYMSNAQARLRVGAKVPDMFFANVINYKSNTAKLYEFKGKLTLLGFWAGYCTACIHKMPLPDSLQKAYPKELNVLLISAATSDKKENSLRLLKKLEVVNHEPIGLPMMLGDTMAARYFPFHSIPHYVWINEHHH